MEETLLFLNIQSIMRANSTIQGQKHHQPHFQYLLTIFSAITLYDKSLFSAFSIRYNKFYKNIQNSMGLRDLFHNTILRMDLLSSSPGLRVRKQPSYQTVFGGIFSLLLMIGFGYVLYIQFQNMLNNLQITYTQGLSDDIDSSTSISSLQLAVSIDGVDLSDNTKKFIFFLKQNRMAMVNGTPAIVKTNIALSPCQAADWSSLGDSFTSQFDAFGFTKMLCIANGASFEMTGYIGSASYAYLTLEVVECDQSRDPTCDTPANIAAYMSNYLATNDYFKVRFFLVDTIITPDNSDPVTYILEKNIFMAFTSTIGTVGYINMAEWTLTTDTSPYPMESNTEVTGSFIQSFQTSSVSISSNRYVAVDFFKSTKAKSITRTIGKIDTVLSYVGGLFSLIFTGIAFFIASYSEMRYELYVAEYTLKSQHKGQKIGQSSFGFITYLGYCCYDWLDTFGIAPKCLDRMSAIHETREEACEQLDPVLILKRIKYLEDVSKVLLNEHRELALYLSEPMTVEQAQKMRRAMGYYEKTLSDLDSSPLLEMVSQDEKLLQGVSGNAMNAVANVDAIDEKKEVTEEEQQQVLDNLMKVAVSQLQRDNSEVSKKIKERIGRRARQIILNKPVKKETLTVQDYQSGIVSPTMSPMYANINESEGISKKEKVKMVIKRQ